MCVIILDYMVESCILSHHFIACNEMMAFFCPLILYHAF